MFTVQLISQLEQNLERKSGSFLKDTQHFSLPLREASVESLQMQFSVLILQMVLVISSNGEHLS